LEHRHVFTDTLDGTLAGTWRSTDRMMFPICSWIYDLPQGLLSVRRGRVVREFDCPLGIGMGTDAERRRTLPLRALVYGREMKQPY
jgi:hypothetical protein